MKLNKMNKMLSLTSGGLNTSRPGRVKNSGFKINEVFKGV